jgi:benzodiazapine receptor
MKKLPPLKLNHIVIPSITVIVALLGSHITTEGMLWYDTAILKPSLTPPDWAFPIAWTTIYILTTISAFGWFKNSSAQDQFEWVMAVFLLNAALNVGWTWLFFGERRIGDALIEMLLLIVSLIALHLGTWRIDKRASLLLIPYTAWVSFATFLTYQLWTLNG